MEITLQVVIWLLLATYLVFATRECRLQRRAETLHSVEIEMGDTLGLLSAAAVRGWLDGAKIPLEGAPLEQVDTRTILDTIEARPSVSRATAHTELPGVLHIVVWQRRPVLRIVRGDGSDAYVSDDLWLIPTRAGAAQYVPVVTGAVELPLAGGKYGLLQTGNPEHEKNLLFLGKLINFVKSVESSPFWRDEITQIVVRDEERVELFVRSGGFVVVLGELEGWEDKLEKLDLFYRNVLPYEGWDSYGVVDASYRNQIVCR